jgi:hypothetical protein
LVNRVSISAGRACYSAAIIPPTLTTSSTIWFKIVGVEIGNATEKYPKGDGVQVVEPWTAPDNKIWKNVSIATLNRALDNIDKGYVDDKGRPTGERYSAANDAKGRAAWTVVQTASMSECDVSPEDCKAMIKEWLKNGTLHEREYDGPEQRKKVKGLFVDNSKRPGTVEEEMSL